MVEIIRKFHAKQPPSEVRKKGRTLKSSNNALLCQGGASAYIRLTNRSKVVQVSHVLIREDVVVVVVVVVSHIQRIGCQPEKTTLHGGQSRSWSAEQGKENKRKSLAAYPPPTPHTARSEKINKITRRIYRRYAGGTRIPSARRLGLWVWLRNILHSRLR